MPRQLRVVDGPLAGATYVLRKRTQIGRAADSEIQIIHDGVSRQHAQIVEIGPNEHEVIDLHSNNGTWVGGDKIERSRLAPGDQLRIVGATFVYEEAATDAVSDQAEVYAVNVTSGRTLRRTMSVSEGDLAPRREPDTLGGLTPPPEPVNVRSQTERHHIVASRPDGSDYEGNIISDVVEYRDLRLRHLRQEQLDPIAHRRYEALARELAQPEDEPAADAPARRFCRFRVAFPARLRHGGQTGELTSSAMVVDLGAGGARVACPGHPLREGELAWLVVDLEVGGGRRTFVFTSRVVKIYDVDHVGLIFAGAPEWETWRSEGSR